MSKDNSNITEDLRNLLRDYLTEISVDEFIKGIEAENVADQNATLETSELDRSKVNYDIPKGIDNRILVDRIVTHCEKQLDEVKYYNLLLDLSQLMLFAGENSYSLELAQDLFREIEFKTEFNTILGETNLMISKIYWSQASWDDCEFYIAEASRIFESISSKSGIAKCENMLGTLFGEKGEFDKARKHFENGLELIKDDDDLSTHAMILTNLGIINTVSRDFEKAVWNYKNASERFEELKDNRRLARVYHNLGMLYSQMEKYEDALDEFNKCITISKEMDYLSNCAVAYIGKAYIYTQQKNSALATAYTDKAMEIAYKINDTLSIADIYKIKGMIYNDMDNFQLSEEFFENSIRLNKDTESKLNEAESSAELGKLLKETDREDEAKQYLESAVNFFNGLKNDNLLNGLVERSI
jgi:tetratricopeptide (TPR) repeat protein